MQKFAVLFDIKIRRIGHDKANGIISDIARFSCRRYSFAYFAGGVEIVPIKETFIRSKSRSDAVHSRHKIFGMFFYKTIEIVLLYPDAQRANAYIASVYSLEFRIQFVARVKQDGIGIVMGHAVYTTARVPTANRKARLFEIIDLADEYFFLFGKQTIKTLSSARPNNIGIFFQKSVCAEINSRRGRRRNHNYVAVPHDAKSVRAVELFQKPVGFNRKIILFLDKRDGNARNLFRVVENTNGHFFSADFTYALRNFFCGVSYRLGATSFNPKRCRRFSVFYKIHKAESTPFRRNLPSNRRLSIRIQAQALYFVRAYSE